MSYRPPQIDARPKPLNTNQKIALQLTVDGWSQQQIREKLGITQPTLWRWKQSAAWQQALWDAVKSEQTDGEVNIRTLVPLASSTLKELVRKSSDNVRLGAARLILESANALAQREDQQALLVELEGQLSELKAIAHSQLLPGAPVPPAAENDLIARTSAHDLEPIDAVISEPGGSDAPEPPLP